MSGVYVFNVNFQWHKVLEIVYIKIITFMCMVIKILVFSMLIFVLYVCLEILYIVLMM